MPPKRAFKPVPDGYVCAACSQAGHWIYDCSQYKKTKKKKTSSHEFQPGVDPSPEDIERAKKMQMEMKDLTKTAPNCFCGLPAKLRKCIGTKLDENSRAKGVMFWWCNKDKWDENACKVSSCSSRTSPRYFTSIFALLILRSAVVLLPKHTRSLLRASLRKFLT